MTKTDEFAVDAAMTPRRILPCHAHHQPPDNNGNTRTTANRSRLRPEGPVPGHQLSMPTQQRRRSHDPDPPQFTGEKAGQRRQQQPVLRLQPGPAHLSSQARHLMPQDQQLNILRGLGPLPRRTSNPKTARKAVNKTETTIRRSCPTQVSGSGRTY